MPAILQSRVSHKMSTDKDSTKSEEMKVEDDVKDEDKVENTDGEDKDASENDEKEKETPKKKGSKAKEVKKEEKSDDDEEEDEEDEEEEEADGEDEKGDGDGKVPLLDQPLQLSGTRERKKVQRFTEEFKSEPKDAIVIEIPEGKGTALGDIPRIDAIIQRYKSDELKALHRVLFNRVGKTTMIKKNLRKFNGFDFEKDSDQFDKKKHAVQKLEVRILKSICGILDLEKKGNREEISERIVLFLLEPKDSGKPVPAPRPKRSTAVKANTKGYSESDEEEKRPARSRRMKSKRSNLKEDTSSESEKDQKSKKKTKDSEKEESENEVDEDEAQSSDEDEPKSTKKKGKATNAKKAASKKPNTKKTPNKKAEKKPAKKRKSSKSDEDADDSSSEDEPLSKKTKAPPTDEEIKTYVKEILEGANLEEITMKTVCKQVYAHYPEFDLAHKKDFIKTTVKSLIST